MHVVEQTDAQVARKPLVDEFERRHASADDAFLRGVEGFDEAGEFPAGGVEEAEIGEAGAGGGEERAVETDLDEAGGVEGGGT